MSAGRKRGRPRSRPYIRRGFAIVAVPAGKPNDPPFVVDFCNSEAMADLALSREQRIMGDKFEVYVTEAAIHILPRTTGTVVSAGINGRPRLVSDEQAEEIRKLWDSQRGWTTAALAAEFHVSEATIYNVIKRRSAYKDRTGSQTV